MTKLEKVKKILTDINKVCSDSKECSKCSRMHECTTLCDLDSPKHYLEFIEKIENIDWLYENEEK